MVDRKESETPSTTESTPMSSMPPQGESAAAHEAKAEAKRAAEVARQRARSAFEKQRDSMANQVSGIARALRSGVRELPEEQRSVAEVAEEGANRLEHFSERIRDRDMDSLIGDVENAMRRNPLAFFAGSVAVGFFLSRFLKSSDERREQLYEPEAPSSSTESLQSTGAEAFSSTRSEPGL